MHLQFEANLKHQSAAVDAVLDVFAGAPCTRPEDKILTGEVSRNVLHISAENIWQNVAKLVKAQGLADYSPTKEADFSIEMETGTGKTYVYIRTIFQLHKQYGLHKFMIVVPSVAIREGVLATLRDTQPHFRAIYGETACDIEYNSKHLHMVEDFCTTNHLSIMVINKQAFDKDSNIINAENRDSGNLLLQLQQVRPVIILDEPQEGMDTPNMQERLADFQPLFKLRYSATHRYPKNVINRLTPYDAYNSGLVKKIAVLAIHETNMQSNVTIKFHRLNLGKDRPSASLSLNVRLKSGEIKEKTVTVKRLDDLFKKTGNRSYTDWVVDDIGTTELYNGEGYITFTNGERIPAGGSLGSDKEAIFRQQIKRAIQNHFQRKQQLVPLGIKPLVLFFIDRVDNYMASDGLIRRLFIEEYSTLHRQKYGTDAVNLDAVHNGYFAKNTQGQFTDKTRSMEGETSKAIYDTILKHKTVLLSFDEPLEFIFSHSALGVGWDNPNVFTICTLNESISPIKKRQEIGRGLRLCVQQNGKRYRDPDGILEGQEVNLLTVVPNESYRSFVETYQQELRDEMGDEMGAHAALPEVRDANRKPLKIKRREDRFTSDDFLDLWQRIAGETRCRVHFREDCLIADGIKALSEIAVHANELEISLHHWDSISEEGVEAQHQGTARTTLAGRFAPLNVVKELSRNSALATTTTAAILAGLPEAQQLMLIRNPMQFLAEATKALRRIVNNELVRLVWYEKTERTLSLDELFSAEEETLRDTTPTPKRGLYDHIIHDSEVERNMATAFDNHTTVRLFLKLPPKYKIPTPIGNYTPDFALVMEKRNLDDPENAKTRFYFIIETKGASDLDLLKPDEWMKIKCAMKHFAALGLPSYLAPVDNPDTFDALAREQVGETFFNQ